MVDALTLKSEEGRGLAAIILGDVPSNSYIPRSPNEETPALQCRHISLTNDEHTQGSKTFQYLEE
jgi:hypothetical protein